ncbi:MAG TPA: methyltransferase domain-containing protein [Tepidisphaeraceae bacterium]|nr:methyltransferase domain-containing protein [Tepidisphaeraceae bacterium]
MPTLPAPPSANLDLKFNAYQYADFQAKTQDPYANAKYAILAGWMRKAGGGRPLSVLNAGCGSGELSFLLASHGHQVVGFDPGDDYVAMAKQSAASLEMRDCAFEVADIQAYAAAHADARFDAVVCTDVLEHVRDDVGNCAALVRLLKPGGALILTVPGGPYLFGFHDEQLGHYRRYTLRQLTRILPPDVRLVRRRYFGMGLIPIAYMYSRKWRKPYPVAEAAEGKTMPVMSRIMWAMFGVEKAVPLPLGTSCLLWARKA